MRHISCNSGAVGPERRYPRIDAFRIDGRLIAPGSLADDPLELFRGLLVAIPVSVFGFWIPLAHVMLVRMSHR